MSRSVRGNLWRYYTFAAVGFTPVMLPVIVLFWQENGLDMFEIFLLQALFALAVVVLEVPTGMVADRLGKRQSLVASMAVIATGVSIYATGTGFMTFLAAEITLSLGLALFSGADSALLYDTLKALGRQQEFTRHEGRANALRMVGFALSNLAGGIIGSYSLRATVWASAVGPVVGLFVAWSFVEVQRPERSGSARAALGAYRNLIRDSLKFVRKHRLVRWQIAVLACISGSATWLLWLYQPYLEFVGMPVWTFGLVFASFNLFAAFASSQAHALDRRLGRVGTMAALMLLQTAPPFLMALFVQPWAFIFIFGQQATRALSRPIIAERIMHYTYADKRATVLSMSALAGRLFFALTGPVIGIVARTRSLPFTLVVQGGCLLLVFGFLLWRYRAIPPKYFAVKSGVQARQ